MCIAVWLKKDELYVLSNPQGEIQNQQEKTPFYMMGIKLLLKKFNKAELKF